MESQSRFPVIERKRSKVAIVGFAGTTRHLAPFDDPEFEIWGLNEAHRQPWMRRITRWFQMHKRWDFTKQNNQSYKEHWEWLQKKHPFPIYMQKAERDVPSSVEFPLDQVIGTLLVKTKRGKKGVPYAEQKEVEINDYFTSSFAYMCALALLEGFKTIHVYGFEMATDTEYRYQKGSTEYWLGMASVLCDEVYIPDGCRLLQGEKYGYEVDRMINRQRLEFLKQRYEVELEFAQAEQNKVNGRRVEVDALYQKAKETSEKRAYALRSRDLLEAEVRANASVNERAGRVNMINDLMKTVDNMHLGKDPGDGYVGHGGDLDEEREDRIQSQAEAATSKARKAETEPEPSEG